MEALVILVVAAGLSAAVVWWAMSPPDVRARRRDTRDRAPRRLTASPVPVEEPGDGFVLLPGPATAGDDDRPPPVLSVLRIVVAIAVVAAVAVAAVALIGLFVKLQLDQYFTLG